MTTQTTETGTTELERMAINVIRGLAMDAPFKADSGHQGTAMALAPTAHVLWTRIMNYDASAPDWPDRDRFILSAGHACILQYSMLYLTGYGLTLEDLKSFRTWGSRTPGHPEVGHTPGIEVTTGPLGQGVANGVGMGIAEQYLRERFGSEVCNHRIYVLCSDGDLEEGISHEAASLAGHLGLGRLIYIYDDNHISIDGPTELALSDDPAARFRAYGWHVQEIGEEAESLDAVETAIRNAQHVEDAPSIVIVRSHIAYPSPDHIDDPAAHGLAFTAEAITRTKEVMGLPDEPFWVPDDVLDLYRRAGQRGRVLRDEWERRHGAYAEKETFDAALAGRGLPGWDSDLPSWQPGQNVATRKASGACVDALAEKVPGLVGGGADLTGNTGTRLAGFPNLSRNERAGRQIHFGIREHGMGGILNGMAEHGGTRPLGGTFFVFSDYMRGAVRLAALSGTRSIFVWTHDSVGVGQDGPTHQPIEQLMAMRAMPGLLVLRPADGNETASAWRVTMDHDGPVALVLSRQGLPVLEGTSYEGFRRGAYVLRDCEGEPQLNLLGTGSEVHVCLEAAKALSADDVAVRVISMPSWELYELQDRAYKDTVLRPGCPTLSVEAGVTLGWSKYADLSVGIDRFGSSAPGEIVMHEYGINADNVAEQARTLL